MAGEAARFPGRGLWRSFHLRSKHQPACPRAAQTRHMHETCKRTRLQGSRVGSPRTGGLLGKCFTLVLELSNKRKREIQLRLRLFDHGYFPRQAAMICSSLSVFICYHHCSLVALLSLTLDGVALVHELWC
ncbi:hypothetical protein NDU88_007912 [Pleurodeles waltl]|uniref:Uncharacterized protein n=1 Tax=Pleurodeles waltl TaxID=8319 RepID=A0AAV7PRL9_PLEWA|nr:hypothetical protein NDU88_007912 [Pleurodeles waltl]